MKKLVSVLALATSISTADALAVPNYIGVPRPAPNYQYEVGYRHGKNDGYHNVATTLFVVGAIAIAGVVIYHLGEENGSRWGVSENGLTYKF